LTPEEQAVNFLKLLQKYFWFDGLEGALAIRKKSV
jgi:hypothetical protein